MDQIVDRWQITFLLLRILKVVLLSVALLFAFGVVGLAYLFGFFNPWESHKIPIPSRNYLVTLERRVSHPFLYEYDRRLKISDESGRILSSSIIGNFGGRPRIEVSWRGRNDGDGPFVMLFDRGGTTWINLGAACLWNDDKPDELTDPSDRCEDRSPIDPRLWRLLGIYVDEGGVLKFEPAPNSDFVP